MYSQRRIIVKGWAEKEQPKGHYCSAVNYSSSLAYESPISQCILALTNTTSLSKVVAAFHTDKEAFLFWGIGNPINGG